MPQAGLFYFEECTLRGREQGLNEKDTRLPACWRD